MLLAASKYYKSQKYIFESLIYFSKVKIKPKCQNEESASRINLKTVKIPAQRRNPRNNLHILDSEKISHLRVSTTLNDMVQTLSRDKWGEKVRKGSDVL